MRTKVYLRFNDSETTHTDDKLFGHQAQKFARQQGELWSRERGSQKLLIFRKVNCAHAHTQLHTYSVRENCSAYAHE